MQIETATLVEILPTKIWIESDIMGCRHVVMQHQGCEAFTYASFGYDYRYTSNSGTHAAAMQIAKWLGAEEPIEQRQRELDLKMPTADELRGQIAQLQAMLALEEQEPRDA